MNYNRREILRLLGLSGVGIVSLPTFAAFPKAEKMIHRAIGDSGEQLPIVGLGTWKTFDVGNSAKDLSRLSQVLEQMNKLGGRVIDSSPMYGSSEQVVGRLTQDFGESGDFFYATKVWTSGREAGILQMNNSFKKMQRKTMDLMQIHNLVDWKTHVKTLKSWKEQGKIKYWGITHYVDAAHDQLAHIISTEKPDFAQFNYSILSRNAERSLFETCMRHNTATIINQPYESGSLFRITKGKTLPPWVEAYDIKSWGQYFLKFILSNKAVNCAIPGTSKPEHMIDNMMAGYGKLPDSQGRDKMASYLKSL